MKCALIILVSIFCTLNVVTAIEAKASSSSSAVASGTGSYASSFATSAAVGYNGGEGESLTKTYKSEETSTHGDARASAKATAEVNINNPSPGIIADPCTFTLEDNDVSFSGLQPPSFASCRGGRDHPAERHDKEFKLNLKRSVSKSSESSINAQPEQLGIRTITFNLRGTITDVLTPSKILIGKEIVELDLGSTDPSDLYKGNYEIFMDFLKEKLVGQEVFIKDNYAYFDLNGAVNSVSINEMIQEEVRCKLIEQ
jgi:hypothetical protein